MHFVTQFWYLMNLWIYGVKNNHDNKKTVTIGIKLNAFKLF